jgi:hypothetical protein
METELRKALDSRDIKRVGVIISSFPKEARTYGEEELLAEWAKEFLSGQDATQMLNELRTFAGAMRAATGESLLADIVREVDAGESTEKRAEAFLLYKSARDLYRSGRVRPARQLLDTAERSLCDVHSRLAILANIYRAASVYKENRFADSLGVFNPELDPCSADQHYYDACGVKSWIEGLALVQTGHPEVRRGTRAREPVHGPDRPRSAKRDPRERGHPRRLPGGRGRRREAREGDPPSA